LHSDYPIVAIIFPWRETVLSFVLRSINTDDIGRSKV